MLSIVIPTYNRQSMLIEAVSSAASIPGLKKEIIIVDDGSDDDTPKVANSLRQTFEANSECTFRFERKERGGAPSARNHGMACATGELIIFLDSDDILCGVTIADALRENSQQHWDILHGCVMVTDSFMKPLSKGLVGSRVTDSPDAIFEYSWHTMGAVYRRAALEQSGGWDESLSGSQDWELQARMKIDGWKRRFYNRDVFGYWRMHDNTRIGTTTFRYDYVRSVEIACLLIAARAENKRQMTPSLTSRIARRLFRHAVEYSLFGFSTDRKRVLSEICALRYLRTPERIGYKLYDAGAGIQVDRLVGKMFGINA